MFYYYSSRLHRLTLRRLTPASWSSPISPLKPQEPARAPRAALAAAPCRCAQPFALAFEILFRSQGLPSPGSGVRSPLLPLEKTPRGLQTLRLEKTRSAQGSAFTACGQGTLADFGKPRRHLRFPEPRHPPFHLPSQPEDPSGRGCRAFLADPSAEELGQCFCLLKCCKGLRRKRRVN